MSLRALALSALSVALACVGIAVVAAPAEATMYSLCKGYSGCTIRGYGNAGYSSANTKMYWRMYAGHNCTNYVAYRLVRGGLPNVRPWTGSGNATNWGRALSSMTDQTPTVGAVAWWKAYAPPAGSVGHVAYVEQVISADEIIVSQDSWGGDFSWARITRSGGKWPSGFIHVRDTTISVTSAPVVSGIAKVGSPLQVSTGSWTPLVVTLGYQWLADGVAIPGATKASFTPTTAQLGKAISARVTATRSGFKAGSTTTAATAAVLPATVLNTTVPAVTGAATMGGTLTASAGAWTPTPDSVSYQWIADGTPVSGATKNKLALGASLVGKQVTVKVTARRSSYPAVSAAAVPTPAVAPGVFGVTSAPTISGTARYAQTLTLTSPGKYTGAPSTKLQWTRDGVPIPGATKTTYRIFAADVGHAVAAQMTLTRAGYTTLVAPSAATAAVAPETFRVTRSPAVTGKASYGQTLRLSEPGAYTGTPATGVQWTRDGVPIPGATGTSYRLFAADVDHVVTAQVTLTRPGYATLVAPAPTSARVAALTFGVTRNPTVTGTAAYGKTLTLSDPGSYTGRPTTAVEWLVDGVAVPGAVGRTYKLGTGDLGHRVSARVTLTRPGYTTASAGSAPSAVVKTTSVLSARAAGAGPGKVTVTVRVTAPGLTPVAGVLHFYDANGKVLGRATLSNSLGTATLRLPKGKRTVRATYLGSTSATAADLVRSVTVP